jgi:hypothetical protein
MSLVRRAGSEDAEEILRLRQVMLDSLHPGDPSGAARHPADWHAKSLPTLRARLAAPGDGSVDSAFAAFVVDHPAPERPGMLAALAVGTMEYRIGRSGNPHGRVGHVFSVATDPGTRRRGYAGLVPGGGRRTGGPERIGSGRAPLRIPGLHPQTGPEHATAPLRPTRRGGALIRGAGLCRHAAPPRERNLSGGPEGAKP